ncbi:MAG: glycosyltransferase [Kiritimatiellia bacterium]
MKIIHVNTNDFDGGAYRAAYRLHVALRAMGEESRVLVAQKRVREPGVQQLQFSLALGAKLRRAIRRLVIRADMLRYRNPRSRGFESFDLDRSQYGAELAELLPPCDVVHLHHVGGLLDYGSFFPTAAKKAVLVWTLHDMNPFTGGCHYNHGCDRWRTGCGACPQIGSSRRHDVSAKVWERKRKVFAALPTSALTLVSPSRWLAQQVAQSPILGRFPVRVIPNGIDISLYRPREKALAREIMGLPLASKIVLFVAQQVKNRRKGFAVLVGALRKIANVDRLQLLTVGIDVPPCGSSVPAVHFGAVHVSGVLALLYNAADLLAVPSLEDNLPNTVLEAFACGTPVVASAVGGLPDLVQPGVTGWLVPSGDEAALAAALQQALSEETRREDYSRNCRRMAETMLTTSRQAEAYLEVYRSVCRSASGFAPAGTDGQ